jgi:hypothetical protein
MKGFLRGPSSLSDAQIKKSFKKVSKKFFYSGISFKFAYHLITPQK